MKLLPSLIFFFLFFSSSCRGPSIPTTTEISSSGVATAAAEPPVYTYEIVKTYPHDPEAFTQGLLFDNGVLYESNGLNQSYGGRSSLRKIELETGKVLKKTDVPEPYFAEGLTLFQGQLFQLTWQHHKGFIYDHNTFAPQGEFKYSGEGWGITHDGKSLIMSDGSNELRFIDPSNFKEERRIKVTDRGRPIEELNELEYIKGEIFANIWQSREGMIARINPKDGKVLGWVDLRDLKDEQNGADADVLNGIAYDAAQDRLFVTGKKWSKLFEIRLKQK